MHPIKPSIGRKVWLWSNGHAFQDQKQPFDATIIFVHSDTRITVRYDNHWGTQGVNTSVLLRDPIPGDMHAAVEEHTVATWMPFQVGQAKPVETAKYADGSTATGTAPLPDASPGGATRITADQRGEILQHTENPDHPVDEEASV